MAYSYLQSAQDGTNLIIYTFLAQNLGTAAADRYIICCVSGRSADGAARTITSIVIDGVTATAVNFVGNSGSHVGIYIAAVPSDATGTVVVTWSNTMGDCSIHLHRATAVTSTTPTDSSTDTTTPLSYDIDVVAGGFVVALSTSDDGAATATWAGITEKYDDATGGGNDQSGAGGEFATTQTNLTVSCTWTAEARIALAVASFQVTVSNPPVAKSIFAPPNCSIGRSNSF